MEFDGLDLTQNDLTFFLPLEVVFFSVSFARNTHIIAALSCLWVWTTALDQGHCQTFYFFVITKTSWNSSPYLPSLPTVRAGMQGLDSSFPCPSITEQAQRIAGAVPAEPSVGFH